jgi:hypothetical protein
MSEFIIAVIVILVVLMVISKARKKSDEEKREVPSHKASESEVKPIVKPLTTNEAVAEAAPIIKAEENIVVAISPKVAVSTKETSKVIQIPKDSTLKRHALNQLHTLLESCKENRPTDSTLSRHYDQLVVVKLNDYTNDADEILCLLSFYENYFKEEVVATEIAPAKTIVNTTSTSNIETIKSTLPEDSALRRHAMQLSSN